MQFKLTAEQYFAGIAMREFIRGHRWDENDTDAIAAACKRWGRAMADDKKPRTSRARGSK